MSAHLQDTVKYTKVSFAFFYSPPVKSTTACYFEGYQTRLRGHAAA
jgi:hypothetical protein